MIGPNKSGMLDSILKKMIEVKKNMEAKMQSFGAAGAARTKEKQRKIDADERVGLG